MREDMLSLGEEVARVLRVVEADDRIVIRDGTLVDGSGGDPVPHTDVLLEGGRVAAVGRGISAPDAEVVDAAGRTVMPGLVDAHFHFTGHPPHAPERRYLEPNEDVRALRAARDALRLLRAGYTAAKSMGHGRPTTVDALKRALSEGVIVGPTVRDCGWALSPTGGHGLLDGWPPELAMARRPRSGFCDGVEGCARAVRANVGDGADFIKIFATQGRITSPDEGMHLPNFSIAEIQAICDEAHRLRRMVSAHATGIEGSLNAVRGGVDTLEHGPCEPSGDDEELLGLMAERGTIFVPTLAVFATAAARDTWDEHIRERARRWYEWKRRFVQAARERGIPVAAGTDFSVPPLAGANAQEIRRLVEAGLTPLEAIRAATEVAARAAGLGGKAGRVAPGYWSDVLVVEGDPAEDIRALEDPENIRMIFKSRLGWS